MPAGHHKVEGPWGGPQGGQEWTDGTFSTISRIVVRYGDIVDAIQVQYWLDGHIISAPQHGGAKGSEKTIKLDSDEYVKQIKGEAGNFYGHDVVKSLTIITNKKTYGPFGKGGGQKFESADGRKVVGFHGRSGDYLDRVGVYTFHF